MDDLESKLNQLLSDPASMAQIMGLAKMLGSPAAESPPPSAEPDLPSQAAMGPASQSSAPPEEPALSTLMTSLQSSVSGSDRQTQLLRALVPFLQPERQEKLRRAIKISRLARVAEQTLKNFDWK